MLPRRLERVLVADLGFQHIRLARWALEHGWPLRLRVNGSLLQLGVRQTPMNLLRRRAPRSKWAR